MYQFLLKMVEDSNRAVMLYQRATGKTEYANKLALSLYGDVDGSINMESLFTGVTQNPVVFRRAKERMEEEGEAFVYDFLTRTVWGEEKLTDLQMGYADPEKKHIFLKIALKEDTRLPRIMQLIDHSHRAEGILHFDANLSFIYGNEALYQLLEVKELEDLVSRFLPEKREKLQENIQKELRRNQTFYTELEIKTPSGAVKEISLDFQHFHLDDQGGKLVVFLNLMEEQVKRASKFLKFHSLVDYFQGIQVLSGESLFLVDVKEHMLIHQGQENLNLPDLVQDFPKALLPLFPPEEAASFLESVQQAYQKGEGSFQVRLKQPAGDYGSFQVLTTGIRDEAGEVVELLGKIKRI